MSAIDDLREVVAMSKRPGGYPADSRVILLVAAAVVELKEQLDDMAEVNNLWTGR